ECAVDFHRAPRLLLGHSFGGTPMKTLAALFLFASFSSLVPLPDAVDANPVEEDLAKLKGTWKVVSYEKDGLEDADADSLAAFPTITFDGRQYTWANGVGGKIEAIDPTKKPKSIDYRTTDEEVKTGSTWASTNWTAIRSGTAFQWVARNALRSSPLEKGP